MSRKYDDDFWFEDDIWADTPSKYSAGDEKPRSRTIGTDDWALPDDDIPASRPKKKSGGVLPLLLLLVAGFFLARSLFGTDDPVPTTLPTDSGQVIQTQTTPTPAPNATPTPKPTPTPAPAVQTGSRYFYRRLTADQKQIYTQVFQCLREMNPNVSGIRVTNAEELDTIMKAVYWDCAELFWYDGAYSYTYYDRNGYWDVTVTPVYVWDKATAMSNKAYVESTTASLIQQLQGRSDYAKVKGVYDYLIDRTAYNYSHMNTTIHELLRDRKAVCEGYARATQYLLTKLGVECIYVVGNSRNESHAWNIVNVDGLYYQLDTTWGDPLNDDGSQTKNYGYLLITDEECRREHTADWAIYPTCTSTYHNYFAYEGNYLQSYDMATLKQWAAEADRNGVPLTFKMSSKALYDECIRRLISGKEMWDMLDGLYTPGTTAYHTKYDQMYILTFTWE